MLNQAYISNSLPVITKDSKLGDLELLFESYDTLPLVKGGKYLGVLTYEQVSELEIKLGEIFVTPEILFRPYIMNSHFPNEAIKLLGQINIDFLPVIDENQNYLGVWNDESTLKYYQSSEIFEKTGRSIVIEIEPRNYSLSEISQIAESNNQKITGVEVHDNPINETLLVTIYLAEPEIGDVLDSLERYGYHIQETMEHIQRNDHLKDNYDSLISYLNI